jgi:hypothetical protein
MGNAFPIWVFGEAAFEDGVLDHGRVVKAIESGAPGGVPE